MRQQLERIVAAGAPGVIAAARRGPEFERCAAGVADTTTGRPRSVDEHFRIGSVTKLFTATVLLQLVAEGQVELDESCRRMLNHTSGIFDYGDDPGFVEAFTGTTFLTARFRGYQPDELVALALAHPPTSAPGTTWQYSNTNYILAGQMIERVTGNTYAEELHRRIVRPLGLTGTHMPGSQTALPEPHARHYSPLMLPGATQHDVTELNAGYAWAAGGVVSTLADLTCYLAALLRGHLLPPDLQEQLLTEAPGSSYGLGIVRWPLSNGLTVWGHNGMIHGSFTVAAGTRDGERVVAVNVNSDDRDYSIEAFSDLFDDARS
ncbi:serine hydrolase domain-containing protein [Actinoplanes sp. NPDC051411]|uniref:serine hydrolase domain-containing protein n=1 Tax=Actinoplanes sp. NPDC051411 TaxID=3155522 RepID=UPI0034195A7A